jgi:hypothetical protein
VLDGGFQQYLGSNTGTKKRFMFQWYVFLFLYVGSTIGQRVRHMRLLYSDTTKQGQARAQNPLKWARHNNYEFRGCLAHADATRTWDLPSGNRALRPLSLLHSGSGDSAGHQRLDTVVFTEQHNGLGSGADFEHNARLLVTTYAARTDSQRQIDLTNRLLSGTMPR